MGTQDWQTRVLEEGELQTLLASLGALEGMQVLERQLELRSVEVTAAAEPEIGSAVPESAVDAGAGAEIIQEIIPGAAPAPVSSPAADLAAPAKPPVAPSGWVPTFANPLPPANFEPASPQSAQDAPDQSHAAEEDALVLEEQEAAELAAEPAETAESAQPAPAPELPVPAPELPATFEDLDSPGWGIVLTEPAQEPYADDKASQEAEPSAPVKSKSSGSRGIWSLLATWNGTGILLFLMAVGFCSALQGISAASALVGGASALVFIGIGFGIAAVAARRGRQPQSTISRASFGVRGAAIPIIAVIIARYAATAVAAVAVVYALRWFLPNVGENISVSLGFGNPSFATFYVLLGAVLAVASLLTILKAAARFVVTAVVAALSLGVVAFCIVVAFSANPNLLNNLGTVNSEHALAVASVVIIFIGVVWGTTAADETPDLRSRLLAAKLLSAGLLNFTVIGGAAIYAGYLFAMINGDIWRGAAGLSVFGVLVVLALSHQIRRSADSFRGLGLAGTPWWVVLLSSALVAGAAAVCHELVPQSVLVTSALSLLPVAGVPVVAWLAIIGMDVVIRREDYHEVSLLRDYGFYGKFRLANLIGWALAVAIGFGFLTSDVPGFGWLGYLSRLVPISVVGLQADTGVWLAFAVALLAPLFTIPKVRDQEAEGLALQARHAELIDVAGIEND
jgi:NCS1 family nucleobase:cation symporter-1